MQGCVLVTGSNGGVGSSIVVECRAEGLGVIGLDRNPDCNSCDGFIHLDAEAVVNNPRSLKELQKQLKIQIGEQHLVGLVNNAAVQVVKPAVSLSAADMQESFKVNVVFPLLISQLAAPYLSETHGTIVNIGSIHSKLTKRNFLAYSSSKSALHSLTKALAIELAPSVRVNSVSPAAISTPMLNAGFLKYPDKRAMLDSYHPTGSIGAPSDVSKLVLSLITNQIPFLTGAEIEIGGGIHSVLHDPV